MIEGLAEKKETILTNNYIIRQGQENIQERIDNVVKHFPFEFPLISDKYKQKNDEDNVKKIKSSFKQLNDLSIIKDIKKCGTFLPMQHQLNRISSRMIKGEEEYKSLEEYMEDLNKIKIIEPENVTSVLTKQDINPSRENSNTQKLMINRSDSIRKKNSKKYTICGSPIVETLLKKMKRSRSQLKGGKDKVFLTSVQVPAILNQKDEIKIEDDIKIEDEIRKMKLFQRKSIKKAGQEMTRLALTELSNEMVNQYKTVEKGEWKSGSDLQMKYVLSKIVESNKYIQNIVSKIKYVQNKNSNTLTKSIHNLYRKKKE